MQAKTFQCFVQRNKDEPRRYDFTKAQIVAFRTALGFVGTYLPFESADRSISQFTKSFFEMPDGSEVEFAVRNF